MRFYDFFWSNAPSRVRIALAWKRISVETFTVDVAAGSQHAERFRKLNPLSYVPVLEVDGIAITQSMAILEYLESRYPSPALLPPDIAGQARVRSLAFILACDSQPLVNLRIRHFLQDDLGLERGQMEHWVRHWIAAGLEAYEKTVEGHPDTGEFSHEDSPSFADVCLAPHIVMAKRFGLDMEVFPCIRRIYANCLKLEAFSRTLPAGEKPPLEWMALGGDCRGEPPGTENGVDQPGAPPDAEDRRDADLRHDDAQRARRHLRQGRGRAPRRLKS